MTIYEESTEVNIILIIAPDSSIYTELHIRLPELSCWSEVLKTTDTTKYCMFSGNIIGFYAKDNNEIWGKMRLDGYPPSIEEIKNKRKELVEEGKRFALELGILEDKLKIIDKVKRLNIFNHKKKILNRKERKK